MSVKRARRMAEIVQFFALRVFMTYIHPLILPTIDHKRILRGTFYDSTLQCIEVGSCRPMSCIFIDAQNVYTGCPEALLPENTLTGLKPVRVQSIYVKNKALLSREAIIYSLVSLLIGYSLPEVLTETEKGY